MVKPFQTNGTEKAPKHGGFAAMVEVKRYQFLCLSAVGAAVLRGRNLIFAAEVAAEDGGVGEAGLTCDCRQPIISMAATTIIYNMYVVCFTFPYPFSYSRRLMRQTGRADSLPSTNRW